MRNIVRSSDEQIRDAIAAVQLCDLRSISIDNLKGHIEVLLRGYTFHSPRCLAGVRLYRARKIAGALPSSLSGLGAPPPENINFNQRCNRSGESMFYCSSAQNAPFFEVHAEVGDHLVLSEWRTTTEMLVNRVGYTRNSFAKLKSTRDCPDWGGLGSLRQMTGSGRMRLIDEFFASLFTVNVQSGEEHLYTATIALTEKFLPSNVPGDCVELAGLMYPTIPMNGNCENFALRPKFVKNGVSFVKAEFVIIKAIQRMEMSFDHLDFVNSTSESGQLQWKGRPGQWTVPSGAQLKIRVENRQWVAQDLDGRSLDLT